MIDLATTSDPAVDRGPGVGHYQRMSWLRIALPLAAGLAAAALPCAEASACDYTLELRRPEALPERGAIDDMPVNRLFVTPASEDPLEYWGDWGDGDAPEFIVDETFDALFDAGQEAYHDDIDYEVVHRLADPDAFIGRVVTVPGCATQVQECRFTMGPRDDVPPGRPEVSGLMVELYAQAGGGPVDCPNIESMTFDVEASDDRTPAQNLRLAAYIADDEDALAAATEPAVVWQPWHMDAPPPEIYVGLGIGGEHERDGHHFRRAGRYCFSISAIDMAGNISERSEPQCIDTTDESDSRVVLARGCGCVAGGDGWRGAPWMLLAVMVGWRRRRRSR